MKTRLYKILILTILVIIACSIYLVSQPLPSNHAIEQDKIDSLEKSTSPNKDNPKIVKTNGIISTANPYLENNLGIQVLHSNDLFATAIELLDLAKQGNSEAQYWLFNILMDCGLSIAFREENMQQFVATSLNEIERELNAIQISRCYAFNEENIDNFGKPEFWLKKAEVNHNPTATLAKIVLVNKKMPPKDLVLEAIASRNIDSLMIFSEAIQSAVEKSSWRLAACRLAEICNDFSLNILLPSLLYKWCEGLTKKQQTCSLDISLQKIYLSRFGKEKYQQIEARADELYKKLIAGEINESDLLFNY